MLLHGENVWWLRLPMELAFVLVVTRAPRLTCSGNVLLPLKFTAVLIEALLRVKGCLGSPRLSFVVESMGVLGRSFRFSPQRLNAFLEIQETLQSSQKHIQESAFTRWLTNCEAFLSFFSSLPSALLFLHQQSATDNTCVGLFKTFSKIDNLGLVSPN